MPLVLNFKNFYVCRDLGQICRAVRSLLKIDMSVEKSSKARGYLTLHHCGIFTHATETYDRLVTCLGTESLIG